jgi:iron complex outermembrane recepter protein
VAFPALAPNKLNRKEKGLRFCLLCCALTWISVVALPASGAEPETPPPTEVLELSLERLMDVSVISASRKTQTLSDVSSAVFVINQEDIRTSGATTIPDLLRMVPGVQVARIDGSSWAVSIRGFNGTFANKLLVMIDGRTVYTPLYGGVFWDVQDTLLENVERIEVIRGSGSTMWGANAVNGVINIITKTAQDTAGALVTTLAGDHERLTVGARYGSSIGDATGYRFYFKHVERGNSYTPTPGVDDSLTVNRGGFRLDSAPSNALNLTLQGDVYGGGAGNAVNVTTTTPPFSATALQRADVFGANLLSRLDWLQAGDSKISLQMYYDRADRNTPLVQEYRDTVDIDLQHTVRLARRHEVTWGAGYRFIHDRTAGSSNFFLIPEQRSENQVNLFVQDEITLLPETLRFILGSKVEHRRYSGWELEPSAKISWTPQKGYSLWASVTRSVRTPTRGEQDLRLQLAYIPAAPNLPPPLNLPTVLVMTGNRELSSESLLAYEAGFRADLSSSLSLDLSSFYNRYHGLVDLKAQTPSPDGSQLTVPMLLTNQFDYETSGAELSLQWQALEWWKLKGGYGYIAFLGAAGNDSLASRSTPGHQGSLRSLMAFGRNVDLDLWARYVGANRSALASSVTDIPAYTALDARLAWRPLSGVELSLVGQNLLQGRHSEATTNQNSLRHEVERTLYGKASWAF